MSKNDTQVDFKTKLAQLEEIVIWFESAEIDVDNALDKYQTGLKLIAELSAHLKSAKIEVEKINRKFDLK